MEKSEFETALKRSRAPCAAHEREATRRFGMNSL
jgi:hypothetical protein